MTLALYMDEHIESLITEQLANRGIDVLTVQEDGRTSLPDDLVLARAYELRRVVVTQDADYFGVATRTNEAGDDHYGIAYIRDFKIPLKRIIDDLEAFAYCSHPDEVLNTITRIPFQP